MKSIVSMIKNTLLRSSIEGRCPVHLYLLKDGRYFVTYGAEEAVHHTMVSALDDFNECIKHALTCAGHDVGGEG